mmetsp:Transcript_19516/g.62137  ORF Transcript_19516/g.62137 Transcript_19516/m.62137 type:complete len:204 (-) Transcript_19516:689-1300(-)
MTLSRRVSRRRLKLDLVSCGRRARWGVWVELGVEWREFHADFLSSCAHYKFWKARMRSFMLGEAPTGSSTGASTGVSTPLRAVEAGVSSPPRGFVVHSTPFPSQPPSGFVATWIHSSGGAPPTGLGCGGFPSSSSIRNPPPSPSSPELDPRPSSSPAETISPSRTSPPGRSASLGNGFHSLSAGLGSALPTLALCASARAASA